MKRQVTAPALLAGHFVLLSINNLPHHIHYTSRPFSPSPNTPSPSPTHLEMYGCQCRTGEGDKR